MACIPKAAKLMQLLTDLMRKFSVFRRGESKQSFQVRVLQGEPWLLDFNISNAGLQPNHKQTKAVRTYPATPNKEDIVRFTGLVNFFMACIPKAAKLMQLLTDLMRKSAVFRWSESQNKAFLDTKQALVNATTMQHS